MSFIEFSLIRFLIIIPDVHERPSYIHPQAVGVDHNGLGNTRSPCHIFQRGILTERQQGFFVGSSDRHEYLGHPSNFIAESLDITRLGCKP